MLHFGSFLVQPCAQNPSCLHGSVNALNGEYWRVELLPFLMDLESHVYILDGGLATELERRGGHLQGDPLWSARLLHTNPDLICDVHKSFLMNGADIITTASYQASVDGFHDHLGVTAEEARSLIGRSVIMAIKARDWFIQQQESKGRLRPLITGSVGPYGAYLHDGSEYSGNYMDTMTAEALKDWHRPRVAELLRMGVDVLAVETQPAQQEAEAIVDLLKEFPTAKAWVCFSCQSESQTFHGDLFSRAVESVSRSDQVVAVGVNCTAPHHIEPLLQSAAAAAVVKKPFIVYPNSGEEWSSADGWYGDKKIMFDQVRNWAKNTGCKIIGGCCRVTPEDIFSIREHIKHIKTRQN